MTDKELMLAGQLYMASDETLMKENAKTRRLTHLLNATTEEEIDKRYKSLTLKYNTLKQGFLNGQR